MIRSSLLCDDSEAQMGDTGGLDHLRSFQFNGLSAEMVKQADPFTKQDRYEVEVDFVKQSRFETLLSDSGARHPDILVTSGGFRLPDGAFNPIGDEGKRRSIFLDHLFSNLVRKDKDRHVKARVLPPRLLSEVEHSSPDHQC